MIKTLMKTNEEFFENFPGMIRMIKNVLKVFFSGQHGIPPEVLPVILN